MAARVIDAAAAMLQYHALPQTENNQHVR